MGRKPWCVLAVSVLVLSQVALCGPRQAARADAVPGISGRVTSPSQPDGVAGVLVYSYDLDHCVADVAVTDANGCYALGNMETGSYAVRFETRRAAGAYLDQWYSGKQSFSEAVPVWVNQGWTTEGIDAVLQPGRDERHRAAVMLGSDAGSYGSAKSIAELLESKGFEVEWLFSGNSRNLERQGVDFQVIEEGLSTAKIIFYTGHGVYHGNLPDCRVGGFYTLGHFFGYPELSQIDFPENPVVLFQGACFSAGDHSVPLPTPSTDEEKKGFVAMYANDFMGWQRGVYYDYGSWGIDYGKRNLGFALYYADNYGVRPCLERLLSDQDFRLDELIDEAYVEDPYRYNDESDPANPMGGDYRMLLPAYVGHRALVGNMNLTTRDIFSPLEPPEVPDGYGRVLYFAEGCTRGSFQEYLTLANPTEERANLQVLYLFPDGGWKVGYLTVPGESRTTVDVNSAVGRGRDVSVRVASDRPILAERPMYFSYNGWTGGSDVLGAASPETTWYFAEGYTGAGFDQWVCVLNPGEERADLTFRFQTQEAGEVERNGHSVPAHSRATFKVNDVLGPGFQNSLKLESTRPVVAERAMYFSYKPGDRDWDGGHCVMGATDLSDRYYFAEGTTRASFDQWLTLQNPDRTPQAGPITIKAVYQPGEGQGENVEKRYTVEPGRRYTVFVPDEVGAGKDVSVLLTSDARFLAERPMYFDYDHVWSGGHCVIGSTGTGPEWLFAEGYTGGGFHEWLCLQNPGDGEALVEVTYFTQEVGALLPREVRVPARARVTVRVNDHAGPDYQLSCRLRVKSGPEIVAERPMYFCFQGSIDGGHDVTGHRP